MRADDDFFDEPETMQVVLPPDQQISQGISPTDVTCKDDLQKLYRHDGTPVCVTESGAEKLIALGWMQ